MKKLLFASGILLYMLLAGCNKDEIDNSNTDETQDVSAYMSGFGDSNELPTGTAFVMPAGLKIIGKMKGGFDDSNYGATEAMDKRFLQTQKISLVAKSTRAMYYEYKDYGYGYLVCVIIDVENETNVNKTLDLPAGLIFVDLAANSQNGLLLQTVSIPVPARTTAHARVNLMCCNLGRHFSSSTDEFIFGPVTNHPYLKIIIDILRGKKELQWIEDNQPEALENIDIQYIVWDVTENKILTGETKRLLRSLPDK